MAFARDATEFSYRLRGRNETEWPVWRTGEDVTLAFGDQGRAATVLKKRFMRRRLRLFRLMMRSHVQL